LDARTGITQGEQVSNLPFQHAAINRMIVEFDLYFAVRTIDGTHGSPSVKDIYTQRGKAEWTFNGSGKFVENTAGAK
jgi:hypothetical protein